VHRLLQATLDNQPTGRVGAHCADNASFPYSGPKAVANILQRCNEKNDASTKAQDQSAVVFLCVYLNAQKKLGKTVEVDGIVTEMGKTSFTVLIPEIGLNKLINGSADLKSSDYGTTSKIASQDEDKSTITLQWNKRKRDGGGGGGEGKDDGKDDGKEGGTEGGGGAEYTPELTIGFMTPVRVRLDVEPGFPLNTRFILLAPPYAAPGGGGRGGGRGGRQGN